MAFDSSSVVQSPPPGGASQSDAARSIIETLTTAVLLLADDLTVLALNPAAEALLDVSANKVCGSAVSTLWPGAELWAPALARVLETGQSFTEREMTIETRSGDRLTVDCAATPVAETDPPKRLLVEIFHLDPHRRFSREEQRLAQSESARAVLRGLAHEIKNPLGGIRGAAQLLERELDDAAYAEYTQVVVREADRLHNLVDRMLGPRTPPRMRALNVHAVTERVHALIGAEAPPGVSIVRDYDPSIPEIEADPELLIQAVLNVARNAVQALDGNGQVTLRTRVHRCLTIGQRRHRLVVGLEVIDTGPGVPHDLRGQIFYPMVTGRSDGTGLGLSIAQSLVHQHHGSIEFDSQPGNTIFSILLPVDIREL